MSLNNQPKVKKNAIFVWNLTQNRRSILISPDLVITGTLALVVGAWTPLSRLSSRTVCLIAFNVLGVQQLSLTMKSRYIHQGQPLNGKFFLVQSSPSHILLTI